MSLAISRRMRPVISCGVVMFPAYVCRFGAATGLLRLLAFPLVALVLLELPGDAVPLGFEPGVLTGGVARAALELDGVLVELVLQFGVGGVAVAAVVAEGAAVAA